jgi:predicted PurR-regulated permease PerM
MPDSVVRRITWRNADVARILGLGLVFLFLWKFFWMVHTALFLALIAVLIAIILNAPSRFLSRWIPFRIAFPVVVVLFLAALAGLLIAVVPQILDQLTQLAGQLPDALRVAADWLETKTGSSRHGEVLASINDQLTQFVGRFVPLAFNLISVFAGSFAIIVLAVFLAAQPALYRDLLLRLVPVAGRENALRIYDEVGGSLRNWVLAKAFTMTITGLFIGGGLAFFDVPGALALGALAAVMEFIPNFGPTIAATPAVIAAFLVSPATALYVTIYYFVFQQLQAAITVPLVERRAVNIPPAALLLWQLMLAIGFGLLGLFVATPLLAVLTVAIRVLYLEPSEQLSIWDRREPTSPNGSPEPSAGPG